MTDKPNVMKTLALHLVLYSKMKPLLFLSSYVKNLIAPVEVISIHTRDSSGELREIQQDSPKARKSMIISLVLSFVRVSLKITEPGKEAAKYSQQGKAVSLPNTWVIPGPAEVSAHAMESCSAVQSAAGPQLAVGWCGVVLQWWQGCQQPSYHPVRSRLFPQLSVPIKTAQLTDHRHTLVSAYTTEWFISLLLLNYLPGRNSGFRPTGDMMPLVQVGQVRGTKVPVVCGWPLH